MNTEQKAKQEKKMTYDKAAEICYTACKSINPDNPIAVAEGMKEVAEALAAVVQNIEFNYAVIGSNPQHLEAYNQAKAALNKIQGK